jgi:hypothetical protein
MSDTQHHPYFSNRGHGQRPFHLPPSTPPNIPCTAWLSFPEFYPFLSNVHVYSPPQTATPPTPPQPWWWVELVAVSDRVMPHKQESDRTRDVTICHPPAMINVTSLSDVMTGQLCHDVILATCRQTSSKLVLKMMS